MRGIAKFEKVSYHLYYEAMKDYNDSLTDVEIKDMYDRILLPKRATKGSAGYDFYAPFAFDLKVNDNLKIPTGIRVKIDEGYFLALVPRSSLGFKYRMHLFNTMGIIDSDYYDSDNEGHIFAKIANGSDKDIKIKQHDGFIQGIFMPFMITVDDDSEAKRNGGFGSTNEK